MRSVIAIIIATNILSLSQAHAASRNRVLAPAIAVTPTALVPHGTVQVNGSGFESSTSSRQVLVDITLTNSAGSVRIGTLGTDSNGNLVTRGTLVLPFTIDANGPNQISAMEESNPNIGASTLLAGTVLHPTLSGGQNVAASQGQPFAIRGAGFAPNDVVTISLNGQTLGSANTGNITADTTGVLSATVTIPAIAQPGAETLVVSGSARGSGQNDQVSQNVTVSTGTIGNSLAITPNPAVVGTGLRAQAGGFQPNEPVTFSLRYFDLGVHSIAVQNTPATADANGSATAVISIPATTDPAQGATVSVTGNNSQVSYSVALTFATVAHITITPAAALAGARITIDGTGFAPGENLFATSRLFKPVTGRFAQVDITGHFSATVTLLSTLQPGTIYDIAVSGTGGDQASTTFTVAAPVPPALTVSPSTAPAGEALTVTGKGLGPDEAVLLSVDGVPLSATSPISITDSLGVFTATVTLPGDLLPGRHTLQAKGAMSGITATARITTTLPQSNHWYFAEGFTGQGPKVFFHETITLLNYNSQPAVGAIVYGFPDGSTASLPVSVKANSVLVEDVNRDVGPNRIVSALVRTDRSIVAQRTITRTDAAKHTLDTDFSPGQNAPQTHWYFAEGYSGVTFQPYLTVQNPASTPISLTVTLFPSSGAAAIVNAALPPFIRYTLNLRSVLPNKSFSINVTASAPIVAERVEYWGAGAGSAKFGAGVKPGVSTPGHTWYFGFGSVLGGDQTFISVLNPTSTPAHVQARYFNGTGKAAGLTRITVLPGQRSTLFLNKLLGPNPHSPIAALVSGDLPIVAEEAQYFGGSPNIGTHTGASIEGRQATAARWSFASGNTTKAYQESEYIFNPTATVTTITARFLGQDGQIVTVAYPLAAKRVITVSANAVPGLHRGVHGSVWTSAKGVHVVVTQVLHGSDGRSALADQGIPGQ